MLHTLVKAYLKLEEVDGSRNLAAPGLRRACGGSLSCRDRCGSFGCTWPAELAVYTPKSAENLTSGNAQAGRLHSSPCAAFCKRCTL